MSTQVKAQRFTINVTTIEDAATRTRSTWVTVEGHVKDQRKAGYAAGARIRGLCEAESWGKASRVGSDVVVDGDGFRLNVVYMTHITEPVACPVVDSECVDSGSVVVESFQVSYEPGGFGGGRARLVDIEGDVSVWVPKGDSDGVFWCVYECGEFVAEFGGEFVVAVGEYLNSVTV